MPACARCGDATDESPLNSDYAYCDSCQQLFKHIRENGVWVWYRINAAAAIPAGYCVESPSGSHPHVSSQTKALAKAKDIMEKTGMDGLFEYRPTQSRWLIDEYLDAHPSIARDVEKERRGGILSRLFG